MSSESDEEIHPSHSFIRDRGWTPSHDLILFVVAYRKSGATAAASFALFDSARARKKSSATSSASKSGVAGGGAGRGCTIAVGGGDAGAISGIAFAFALSSRQAENDERTRNE